MTDAAALWTRLADSHVPDAVLEDLWVFRRAVVARSRRLGLCTVPRERGEPCERTEGYAGWLGRPAGEVAAALLASSGMLDRAVGMACLDSATPVPAGAIPCKAGDLVEPYLGDAQICFVGHFPLADAWRGRGRRVDVVELDPQPGDVPWGSAAAALARAEVVFVTGQAVTNGTLPQVLARCPRARLRVLMGPSVPLVPGLLDLGLDVVGGSVIAREVEALRYWQHGGMGVHHAPPGALQPLCLVRPGALAPGPTAARG